MVSKFFKGLSSGSLVKNVRGGLQGGGCATPAGNYK